MRTPCFGIFVRIGGNVDLIFELNLFLKSCMYQGTVSEAAYKNSLPARIESIFFAA